MIAPIPKPTPTRDRLARKHTRDLALRGAVAEVWKRDSYQCRACGRNVVKTLNVSGAGGHVHHLMKRSQSKPLRADIRNMVLLCAIDHAAVHTYTLVIHGADANGVLRFERTGT